MTHRPTAAELAEPLPADVCPECHGYGYQGSPNRDPERNEAHDCGDCLGTGYHDPEAKLEQLTEQADRLQAALAEVDDELFQLSLRGFTSIRLCDRGSDIDYELADVRACIDRLEQTLGYDQEER